MDNFKELLNNLILILLTIDTIRALIAMLGWVKPESRWAWLFYGRYDRNLIVMGLKELGFDKQTAEEVKEDCKSMLKAGRNRGITEENAAEQLIRLIAKYIEYYENPIEYGGEGVTHSSYYIDTMEMVHDDDDREDMVAIMLRLYSSIKRTRGKDSKPVIVVPKGGNPLFATAVAKKFDRPCIIAKSRNDKSRITLSGRDTNDAYKDFKINYEGSWKLLHDSGDGKAKKCVLMDCNTSGGSQLLDIINDLRIKAPYVASIDAPSEVYLLFRADKGKSGEDEDIDKRFSDNGCTLFRFFDLDEDLKKAIYDFKMKERSKRAPSVYNKEDKAAIDEIIEEMKSKKLYYYKSAQRK